MKLQMERMEKTLEATKTNFNTVRTGRASPSLLDRVEVKTTLCTKLLNKQFALLFRKNFLYQFMSNHYYNFAVNICRSIQVRLTRLEVMKWWLDFCIFLFCMLCFWWKSLCVTPLWLSDLYDLTFGNLLTFGLIIGGVLWGQCYS